MVKLTVEPPDYYPVVDKFFADGLVEALEALGIDVMDIKAGVKALQGRIRIGFLIELTKPDAFSRVELETIVSAVLEKLAEDATKSMGKFYNASFEIAGFKIIESQSTRKNKETKLVIKAPEDMRINLERLGKGLTIYLRDRGISFSTLVINVPKDGRPKGLITLLLKKPIHPLEKERIAKSIFEKSQSYLRTLNMDYLEVDVRVLDQNDRKAPLTLNEKVKEDESIVEGTEDETVKEILEAFGRGFPEL